MWENISISERFEEALAGPYEDLSAEVQDLWEGSENDKQHV